MVSGINSTGVGALGVDPRLQRTAANVNTPRNESVAASGDRVEIGDAAAWAAARESVRNGLAQIASVLEIGDEAQGFLTKIQDLARAYEEDPGAAEAELRTTISQFADRVKAAIQEGVRALTGETISVQAEPGSAPLAIDGLNLQVPGGVFAFDENTSAEDIASAVQKSRELLQGGLTRLLDSARALEAHQGFLSAASAAGGVRGDLNADSARLLALQVRQGLEGLQGGAIANAEPQAVLALFRV